jgi:hypothetical protein
MAVLKVNHLTGLGHPDAGTSRAAVAKAIGVSPQALSQMLKATVDNSGGSARL